MSKAGPASWESWLNTSPPPDNEATDIEAIAEEVFTALADPSRRGILAALAAGGPATATDLAAQLPITRQAIAKKQPGPRGGRGECGEAQWFTVARCQNPHRAGARGSGT